MAEFVFCCFEIGSVAKKKSVKCYAILEYYTAVI